MLWKAISIFVLEFLSVAIALTGLQLPTPCCFGDRCYLRPDPGSIKTWTQAQERCKDFKSTLPIVDSAAHSRSFVAALDFYQLSGDGVWIGAKAFDDSPNNWTWLDGNEYFGADFESRGQYDKSYAYLTKGQNKVIASPSSPIASYSYICQHQISSDGCKNGTGGTVFYKDGRCFVKYDEPLPWFSARNICLSHNGDLASFSSVSLLDDVIDAKAYWVGLRHSQWKWLNAVNNLSSDVTFTLWNIDQPDDKTPTCISTSTDVKFPAWRDFSCAQLLSFICQVESSLIPTTGSPACTAPSTISTTTTSSLSPTNRNPSESLSSSTTKHNTNNNTTHSVSPEAENQKNDTGSVNIALAVGLGVGIGVPVIILIVVVIIVIIVRRKRQSGKTEEQNRRDQSVSLPQDSPTPPTYMQLNMADRLEKNIYAKIGSSPDYLQTEESTHDSGNI